MMPMMMIMLLPSVFLMVSIVVVIIMHINSSRNKSISWNTGRWRRGVSSITEPSKVVTGGTLGHIYVIDYVSRKLSNRLRSVGWEINDIRTCPANSNLIVCASSDQSIRIHHIRNEACLIVIGGLECHAGTILSVDWSTDGDFILSCGFDHQLMEWDLSVKQVKEHLERACKALHQDKINVLTQSQDIPYVSKGTMRKSAVSRNIPDKEEDQLLELHRELIPRPSCLLPIYTPSSVSTDMHSDYVDCIRFLIGTNYALSKGCGNEKAIHFWRFGPPKGEVENRIHGNVLRPKSCTTKFRTMNVPSGSAWFIKFAVDPRRRWLVCGGAGGSVMFFDLRNNEETNPTHTCSVGSRTVRQASFSTCGRFLVLVTDEGFVCRFDRVSASVDAKDLAKF